MRKSAWSGSDERMLDEPWPKPVRPTKTAKKKKNERQAQTDYVHLTATAPHLPTLTNRYRNDIYPAYENRSAFFPFDKVDQDLGHCGTRERCQARKFRALHSITLVGARGLQDGGM